MYLDLSLCFFQLCGNSSCCFRRGLRGPFDEGATSAFSGEDDLGECHGHDLGDLGEDGELAGGEKSYALPERVTNGQFHLSNLSLWSQQTLWSD